MNTVIFPTETTALLPRSNTIVSMEGSAPAAAPSQPIVKDDLIITTDELVPWGANNDFPQQVLKRARKSTIIPTALKWQANLISQKVHPVLVHEDDNGKEVIEKIKDPEILNFVSSKHFQRYIKESANDLFWFLNIFPELILSKDRKKITHIHPNDASYCRYSKQNEKTGLCDYVHINANWPYGAVRDDETITIKTLDPYQYDLADHVRESSQYKYIYPSSYPTPGNSFYQLAHWDGIRTSGWLDVLEKVPAIKKSLFENQMIIKYHLQIPREYWKHEYGAAWDKMSMDERNIEKKTLLDNIDKRMVGSEKAGIAFATEFGVSAIDGKTIEGWKIEALPDKLKDGAYLADNMEATAHLLYALGIDPALFGFASKEMGSRSGGSDKRESLLIYMTQIEPYREVLYEPLDFIAEYNGWKTKYPNLEFRSKQTILTTLDTGAGTKTEVI